ncbi:MAG TPA: lysophospholipid acyltransferase family protein [Terriglobales bacterium]|nr:lysophospholipid acyltransferase family protein [Terriglobales bacterium]
MIRTVLMLAFWTAALPVAALVGFPWTFISGRVDLLYRMAMWGAWTGIRLAGVRVETVGLDRIDPTRNYIFMSNHVSNLDPPILIPLIPGRTSVMVKKELFKYPILGKTMRLGSLVPVDRGNREAGIAAVREASVVLRQGINMTIYVEGKRSFDGQLLPFKKGPFYLAMEAGIPVVPVTTAGTHYVMPKRRFSIKPGTVTVIFHEAIEPKDFVSRECLMTKVWEAINSGLPPEYRQEQQPPSEPAKNGNKSLSA